MSLENVTIFFGKNENTVVVPVSIKIFGLSLSFYGIFLFIAALIGIGIIRKEAERKALDSEQTLVALQFTILFGILGARLFYVISEFSIYMDYPLSVFSLRAGGLSFFGALCLIIPILFFYWKKKKVDATVFLDALSLAGAAAAIPVYLGCMFSLEPTGRFYTGSFSVKIPSARVACESNNVFREELLSNTFSESGVSYVSMHPVALTGLVFSIFLFTILLLIRKKINKNGTLFQLTLLLVSVFSLIQEHFRAGDAFSGLTGTVSLNAIIATLLFLLLLGRFLFLLKCRRQHQKREQKHKKEIKIY